MSDPHATPQAANGPTRIRWLIFGLAGTTSWLLYLHRYAWGVVKPDFKSDNPSISPTQMGVLDSAFMTAYALGQVPLGLLGDRFGPRVVLTGLIVAWSVTVACIGVVHDYWLMFATLATFGLVQAGAYPLLGKVTRNWFPLGYRTTVQGMVTSLGRIGGACAPLLIAGFLVGELEVEWRAALVMIALPGLALAVAVYFLLRDSPAEHPWTNETERALLATNETNQSGPARPTMLDRSPETMVSFGMLLFYSFASTFADMLYVYWIPTFLRDAKNLSHGEMGLFAPLPLLGGAVGGFLGGVLNDVLIRRLGNRRWGRSLVAFTGKTLAAVFIATSVNVVDGRTVMVMLLACKFFGDWSLPTQWGAITDMSGRSAATIFGVVNMVGSMGGMLASPIMGHIRQHHGWDALFFFVAAVYASAALAWLAIDCTRPVVRESSTQFPNTQ